MGTCKNCEWLWMGLSLSCGYRTIGDDGRERPVTGGVHRAPGLRMYRCCTGLGRARYAWTTGVGRAELRDTWGEHLTLLSRSAPPSIRSNSCRGHLCVPPQRSVLVLRATVRAPAPGHSRE